MAHDLKECIRKLSTEDPSSSVTGFAEQMKVSHGVHFVKYCSGLFAVSEIHEC